MDTNLLFLLERLKTANDHADLSEFAYQEINSLGNNTIVCVKPPGQVESFADTVLPINRPAPSNSPPAGLKDQSEYSLNQSPRQPGDLSMENKLISIECSDIDTDVNRLVTAFLSIRDQEVKSAILNIIEHVSERDATELCAMYAQHHLN